MKCNLECLYTAFVLGVMIYDLHEYYFIYLELFNNLHVKTGDMQEQSKR